MKKFEVLEHPADLKIKAYGKDLPELFINMALGVAEQQCLEITRAEPDLKWETIEIKSSDPNSLLIDWLNQILSQGDINHKIYFAFEIEELNEISLKAQMSGLPFTKKEIEIKAATYHSLEIIKEDEFWTATVIFDI